MGNHQPASFHNRLQHKQAMPNPYHILFYENEHTNYNHPTANIQVSLPALTVKNWVILLKKRFTAQMPLMMAARECGIWRRQESSLQ